MINEEERNLRRLLAKCSGHLTVCMEYTNSKCSKELLEQIYEVMPHLRPLKEFHNGDGCKTTASTDL